MSTYYVHPGNRGDDRNSGLYHARPRKTIPAALKPGDTVCLAQGQTFTVLLNAPHNEITYKPYVSASDSDTLPTFTGLGINVAGQGNVFEDIGVDAALTAVYIAPLATGNTFRRVFVDNFGHGFLVHGSDTTIDHPVLRDGVMIRDVLTADYVGATAFTLWKHETHPLKGVKIYGTHVEDAFVSAKGPKDGEGSIVELFGGVTDVEVIGVTGLNCKVLFEVGGTQGRKEEIRNILFSKILTVGSGGKVGYWNDPVGPFGVAWADIRIQDSTFIADGYPESPFFFSGTPADLSGLSISDTIIVASSQVYNSGDVDAANKTAATNKARILNTIQRHNVQYWRTDGGKSLGVTLNGTERLEDPAFNDRAAHDYRLPLAHWPRGAIGARGRMFSAGERQSLKGPVRTSDRTVFANSLVGGFHVVQSWAELQEMDKDVRVEGMHAYVTGLQQEYVLARGKKHWSKA